MSPIITALDYADTHAALALVDRLDPALTRLKVGNQLFTAGGPALVETLQSRGFEVFLDLKFHDIPNTVSAALESAASLGVWMVNVHASGGMRMLEAARQAVPRRGTTDRGGTYLIAVTVLTSLEAADLEAVGLAPDPDAQVRRLGSLTSEAGLDGVVCSPREIGSIRDICGDEFLVVTPGIRPASRGSEPAAVDDQRRIETPEAALAAGADYLVMGRPITRASDPLTALKSIRSSLHRTATA